MGTAYEVVCSGRDRGEWLLARRDGLGGSDAASVLGVNPYGSAMSVYTDKLGLHGDPDPNEEVSEQARWGRILEPHVIAEFTRRSGRKVRRDGRLLRSRRRPWQLTTLDARQWDPDGSEHEGPGLVEAKTTRFEWQRIPLDLWTQVQHQFAVTGYTWGTFVTLDLMRRELKWVDIAPDPELQRELIEREGEFWSDMLSGVPPIPDGSEASAAAIKALYPEPVPGKVISLGPEIAELSDELEPLKGRMKVEKARRDELENEIKAALGDAEEGTFADGTGYTFRLHERRERMTPAGTYRTLRFTGGKD